MVKSHLLMAEQSEEEKQVQTALTILLNAASQARLIAAEHDQVRQAAQIVASKLGLTEGQDVPNIEMPEDQ
jgi:electron transfer flavoprotein alpha subunit